MRHNGTIKYEIETTPTGSVVRINIHPDSMVESRAVVLQAVTQIIQEEYKAQKKELNSRSADDKHLFVSDIGVTFEIVNMMRKESIEHIQDITGKIEDN